ncbi:MAG: YihA family ribosome biogenesis GTP-binding protein [Clostridia bacterium]|nr:YihA family ribosome biogenesis GTP-binding protein [Clostridia bacterium]MBO5315199.1 YihA family ribosome biogenesis GTP-binding protein [Clostridia bacterium]
MKVNTNNASLALTVGQQKQFPRDPKPEIALSGRSNVGKSSLINTLLGRKSLARVSSAPGKTITINYYDVDKKLYLVDLPGYGFAKRSQDSKRSWSTLTEDFFVKNPSHDALKLVIQLIDIRTGPSDDDIMMINMMIDRSIPFTVVATKTDKLSKTALQKRLSELEEEFFMGTGITILPFSSVSREGRDELWKIIFDAAF